MKPAQIDTPEKRRFIDDQCAKNKDMPSRMLGRMLYRLRPELFPSAGAAYSCVRSRRGTNGKSQRASMAPRPELVRNTPPSSVAPWLIPRSLAKPWTPFAITARRILVLSDVHIPFHDTAAIESIVKWGRKWNPDCVLLNGDICDFFSISRFSKDFTKTNLVQEVDLTRQFLGWVRDRFPGARLIFKEGNHDERLNNYLWAKAPELYGLPGLTLQKLLTEKTDVTPAIPGVEWVTDQRRIQAGYLTILHGHEMGRGSIAPPVNPARGFFMRALECTLAGHLHRTSTHNERSMNGKLISCWSTGCLCDLTPEYARVNKWDHGAAAIELTGQDFSVQLLRVLNGKVLENNAG